MATKLDFDELNILGSKSKRRYPKSIPYKEYFGAMYITPEQMRNRMDLAEEIEDVMLWLFAYWIVAAEAEISKEELKQDAKDKLTSVIAKHSKLDPYLEKHISQVVDEVVDVTERQEKKRRQEEAEDIADALSDEISNPPPEDKDKEEQEDSDSEEDEKDYWLSRERARLIAENEANAFENYREYREAKAQGKTKKTWITELDDKVRLTHELAEGQTVDIDGLFLVGGYEMRFPKDTEYDPDPSETVNCRCSCEYK